MKGLFRAAGVILAGVVATSVAGATEHAKDSARTNEVSKKRMPRASAPDGIAHPKGIRPPSRPKAYGTSNPTWISLLSYAFQGNNPFGDVILDDGDAYRYFQNSTDSRIFSASVSIPAGAQITEIGFDNCDNFATGTMTMHLVDRSDDHQEVDVAVVSSTDGFCGFDSFTLTTPYDHDDNFGHVFEIFIEQDLVDETLKFRSAFVEYGLRVSPAPAVPTFNDVPANDFGFQYIEALAASGITGGTGGDNYSPNAPVTRRQMAIFIAKALGLYWPY